MENFDQPLDVGASAGQEKDGLRITPEVKLYWKQTSAWAMFFAVLLFIVFGLISIMGLVTALAGGAIGLFMGLFIVAIYSVFLFFPGLYYYRFSTQMKQALNTDDTRLLDQAFVNLRQYYRFVGILLIVFIALYLIIILVYGAAMMRSSGFPTE